MADATNVYGQDIVYQGFIKQEEIEGQPAKRIKLEDGSSLPVTNPENPHYAPPSKVVHIRSVSEAAREQDIVRAVGEFGRIGLVSFLLLFLRFAIVSVLH